MNKQNIITAMHIHISEGDIMNISKDYNENELTLSVAGEIDTFTAPELEKSIDAEICSFESLIIDFTKLEYLSSSGLRVLISEQKKLYSQEKSLKIVNSPEIVMEIFIESGLDQIFDIS